MNEISVNTNMINIFNLFAATRCCRDKRQGKKDDGGLGSNLIVGYLGPGLPFLRPYLSLKKVGKHKGTDWIRVG